MGKKTGSDKYASLHSAQTELESGDQATVGSSTSGRRGSMSSARRKPGKTNSQRSIRNLDEIDHGPDVVDSGRSKRRSDKITEADMPVDFYKFQKEFAKRDSRGASPQEFSAQQRMQRSATSGSYSGGAGRGGKGGGKPCMKKFPTMHMFMGQAPPTATSSAQGQGQGAGRGWRDFGPSKSSLELEGRTSSVIDDSLADEQLIVFPQPSSSTQPRDSVERIASSFPSSSEPDSSISVSPAPVTAAATSITMPGQALIFDQGGSKPQSSPSKLNPVFRPSEGGAGGGGGRPSWQSWLRSSGSMISSFMGGEGTSDRPSTASSNPRASSGRALVEGRRLPSVSETKDLRSHDDSYDSSSSDLQGMVSSSSHDQTDRETLDEEAFTEKCGAAFMKMEIIRSISGLSDCSICGTKPVVGDKFCEHKYEKMIEKMKQVARPPRVLPVPKYPKLLIASGLLAGFAFAGGLFGIAYFTSREREQRYYALHFSFTVGNFWMNTVSDYLALQIPEGSHLVVTSLAVAFTPWLLFMHWGRNEGHTKFSSAAVVERLVIPKDHYTKKFWLQVLIWVCHYNYLLFGIPAVFFIALVSWFPLNNVGDNDVLYADDILFSEEGDFYYRKEPDFGVAIDSNPLDWSSLFVHLTIAVAAFGCLACYALFMSIGFWIDQCIDDHTKKHLKWEFWIQFPEVAKASGYLPTKENPADIRVLTWPTWWSAYLMFMSFADFVMTAFTTADISFNHTFGGVVPVEWIFVIVISIHIGTMPFALWGVVRREDRKMRNFVDRRAAAKTYLANKARRGSIKKEDIILEASFLNSVSEAQIHAGVSRSTSPEDFRAQSIASLDGVSDWSMGTFGGARGRSDPVPTTIYFRDQAIAPQRSPPLKAALPRLLGRRSSENSSSPWHGSAMDSASTPLGARTFKSDYSSSTQAKTNKQGKK